MKKLVFVFVLCVAMGLARQGGSTGDARHHHGCWPCPPLPCAYPEQPPDPVCGSDGTCDVPDPYDPCGPPAGGPPCGSGGVCGPWFGNYDTVADPGEWGCVCPVLVPAPPTAS
jgi:hypothetical protein